MPERAALPATVADEWAPRDEAWLARGPSPHAGAPDRPLFIGACPRSGTTLLRAMLDNHPDIAVPPENDFVMPLWWRRRRLGDLREEAARRAAGEWIFGGRGRGGGRLRARRLSREEAVERVAAAGPTIGSLVAAALGVYAEATGKPRWGDKRPAYSGFIGPLFAMFPDAVYVNLVRDPRGAVASQIPMGWDPPEVALPAAIARWQGAVARTDAFVARLRPDQVLDVRYEDLVAEPAAVLERVCAFAGLRGGETIAAMITADRGIRVRPGPHERLAQPVTTASVERWRERLAPDQVALVEHATRSSFARFGYRAAPDLDAAPRAADLRELARQRRRNRAEWRRSRRDELVRRALYRRDVRAR